MTDSAVAASPGAKVSAVPLEESPRISLTSDLAAVAVWFVVTRVVVVVAAIAGAAHVKPGYYFQSLGGPQPPAFLAPFVRWDSAFYIDLARNGYPPARGAEPIFHAAFFPLYPLVVRAVDTVVHETVVSAMLVSNLAIVGAAVLICRLARTTWPEADDRSAAVLLLASPGADFLSFPYSESLFCLLLVAGLGAALNGRIVWASLFGALASASRPTGLVVALALVLRAWQHRRSARELFVNITAGVVACAGVAAFALFCHHQYGDALYFSHIQSAWGRHMSLIGPIKALAAFQFDPDYYVVSLAAIAGAVWMWRRSPPMLTATAWFLLLVPLSTGSLKSMIRFQGANVPLLAGVAPRLGRRSRGVTIAASLVLLAYETYKYSSGFDHN
jgi:hypothetical protein